MIVPDREAFERRLTGRAPELPWASPGELYAALEPRTAVETPALRLLDRHLVDLEAGRISRLAVSIGPQTGKSHRISRAYPLWALLRDPERRVMIVSYQQEIAARWGRQIRTDIFSNDGTDGTLDLGLRVRADTYAADRWQLDGHAGGVVTVGIGGSATGRPADLLVIDDPFRDAAAARSRATREAVREFWTTVAVPRLAPGAPVVVLHTRWREDDLIGWLLKEHGDEWVSLNIPACSEGDGDPLGRPEGEWLETSRGTTPDQWEKTRREVGEYDFAALYQGSPKPSAGGLFQRSVFRYWAATGDPWTVQIPGRIGSAVNLRTAFRFLTVDLAASIRSSADWTVAAAWAVTDTGELLLLDLRRAQVSPAEHWDDVVGPLARKWDAKIFVEGSQYGTDLVYSAGREGAAIQAVHADRDKYTRAVPAARLMGQGRILLPPPVHWLLEYEEEHLEFPSGKHDDQVDCTAYAARVVSAYWSPPPSQQRPPIDTRARIPDAVRAAFGDTVVDIGRTPL